MSTIQSTLRQYQNLVISGVIILFCVVGILFAAVPSIAKIQEMVQTTVTLSGEIRTLSEKQSALQNLDEISLREQLANALSAVPAERSFPTLFETVEGVAAQTNVAIKSMNLAGGTTLATPSASKISATEKKIGTRTVPFTITVEGGMSALENFITLTPNVRRLLRIKTFSITFPKDISPITISVDMDAFYEPLPTSVGKTKAILPTLTAADEEVITKLSQLPLVTTQTTEAPPPLIGRVKSDPFSP